MDRTGLLDVGDGHQLYYEDWGNPQAVPIFYLHGGPGGGFSDSNKLLFNPEKHRVIFHDQRGSGRSLPFAETNHNTTEHLVADIEKLREKLGIENMAVVGGSWGSALALLYALAHPERVSRLVLWSVFLARQFELDYVNEGRGLRYFFPEAFTRFQSLVPQSERETGNKMMQYYADKIRSTDPAEAKRYADEWCLWESTLLSLRYDSRALEAAVMADEQNVAIAHIETHYFLNGCFVPENYILDTINRIRSIPCSVVQGRFDFCTPAVSALDLATAYGPNLTLQWTNAGHLRTEPENFTALRAIMNAHF